MSGHRKWSEVRASRQLPSPEGAAQIPSPEGAAQNPARAEISQKLRDHAKSLAELRRARLMTQKQLANLMRVSQAQISRVENQADLYLSTLRSYIDAMDGELQIRVAFPGTSWTEVAIGDITETDDRQEDAPPTVVSSQFTADPLELVVKHGGILGESALRWHQSSQPAISAPALVGWLGRIVITSPESDSAPVQAIWGDKELSAGPGKLLALRTPDNPYEIPDDTTCFVSSAELKEL